MLIFISDCNKIYESFQIQADLKFARKSLSAETRCIGLGA